MEFQEENDKLLMFDSFTFDLMLTLTTVPYHTMGIQKMCWPDHEGEGGFPGFWLGYFKESMQG